MAGGFGYPYFVFYAPLIYILSALFHLMGLGVLASVKCMMILGVLLSGVGMFLFARLFLGTPGGFVSAVAYLYLPYRTVNLYVRGDLAEAFAMSLIPWIFFFLTKTVRHRERFQTVGLALSYAALIGTHNCTALIASGLIAFYLFFIGLTDKNYKGLLSGMAGLGLGVSLSAVFWLPALLEKNLVQIELIYSNAAFDFHNNFLEPFRLLSPLWSLDAGIGGRDLPLQIGAPHVLLTLLALITFWENRFDTPQSLRQIVSFFLLCTGLLVFLTQPSSTIAWEIIPLMRYIQFPWRLLSLIGFCASFLAGTLLCFMQSASKEAQNILRIAVVVGIVLLGWQYCYVRGYYILDEADLTPAFVRDQWSTASSYNTKEMARIKDFGEYLPKTVKRLPDRNKAGRVMVASGQAHISGETMLLDRYLFDAVVEEEAEITIGSFFYPSWRARAGLRDITLFTDEEGLIHFRLPKGQYRVDVFFAGSTSRSIGSTLSVSSLVILLGIPAAHVIKKIRRPQYLKRSQS
jgi:hypothetical protein